MSGVCNLTLMPVEKFENNCTKSGMKKHKSLMKGDLWPPRLKTFSGGSRATVHDGSWLLLNGRLVVFRIPQCSRAGRLER